MLQLIGAPILGRWSDRYGRKRILFLSQAGTFVSWVIFAVALLLPPTALASIESSLLGTFTLTAPLGLIFVARALDGLTGGNVSVANAYVADITSEEDRSRSFGRMGVSSNLGFIVGPALAGLLGATQWGETLPVVAALLISLIATILIAVLLPESNPYAQVRNPEGASVRKVFGQEHRDCFRVQQAKEARARDALKQEYVPLMLLLYFVIFLGFNFFYPRFPFWPSWSVYDSRLPAAMQRFSHCCQVRYSFRCRSGLRMLADHGVPAKPEGPLATPLPRRPSATRVRWLFRAVDVTLRAQVAPKSAAACRRTTSGSDAPPQAATNNIAPASRAVRPSSSADAASSSATSF